MRIFVRKGTFERPAAQRSTRLSIFSFLSPFVAIDDTDDTRFHLATRVDNTAAGLSILAACTTERTPTESRHVRSTLHGHRHTAESGVIFACSLIRSGMDYCKSVLHGSPSSTIQKLQRVENNAARIVLQAPRRSDVNSLLQTLHWLPVEQRINYKLARADVRDSADVISAVSEPAHLVAHQCTQHSNAVRPTAVRAISTDIIRQTIVQHCRTSDLELTATFCVKLRLSLSLYFRIQT